jgi:nicotinamidase-related amidase
MKAKETALILIGYQNDYFSQNGILHAVIEESSATTGVLENTIRVISSVSSTTNIIATPIIFTPTYEEIDNPTGILKQIQDSKAFLEGTEGVETISEIKQFGDRIIEVPGKRGLNAFSNTALDSFLQDQGIKNVVFLGAVTSLCIDSSARSAYERGYHVTILSDCTTGTSDIEQEFYCSNIFPLYAEVKTAAELLGELSV